MIILLDRSDEYWGMTLAAGFEGANTRVFTTTVLVVVVLMMLMFGGMTARVLETLEILMDVQDEGASSDAERDTVLRRTSSGKHGWLTRTSSGGGSAER
jgi:hypothetical protein